MRNTTETATKNSRYRQLDSLRGLAAICVFFSHYFMIFKFEGNWMMPLQASPLGILINGRAAVMFFFVLSGFVLSLPFVHNNNAMQLTAFYVKRILRIYPAYVLSILFAIALKTFIYHQNGMAPFSDWIGHFWAWKWNKTNHYEIAKTFVLIGPRFNADLIDPVIWSLKVEMQMSLLLPFFIMIISRGNAVFNFLFFLIVLALIYNHPSGYLGIFYLGVLCSKYKDYLVSQITSWKYPLLIIAVLFTLFGYNISFEFLNHYGDAQHPFGYFWRDYLTAFSCCVLILIAISRESVTKLLQYRLFTFLGDISYSFYLVHLPILITICSLFGIRSTFSGIYIFSVAVILAFVISYLFYLFIEKPFQRYAKLLVAKLGIFKTLNIQ